MPERIGLLKERVIRSNRSRKKHDAFRARRDSRDRICRRRQRRDPDQEHSVDVVQCSIERFGHDEIAAHDIDAVREIARLGIAAQRTNR